MIEPHLWERAAAGLLVILLLYMAAMYAVTSMHLAYM